MALMADYGYEGLGISKKWKRILKGTALVTAGAAVGYYAGPKLVTFLKSKGFTDSAAKALSDKIAAGQAKLPPELEAEAARTVPLQQPTGAMTWAIPVGVGVALIAGMMFMMPARRRR